jgi:3-isopropylmalate/(R)-2-methylmalate dehydratase small subunit
MAYDKFNIINSSAIPLNMDNVDTDQIIPARYLKATERKGFGDNLFRDWRYDSNNEMIKDFPFNSCWKKLRMWFIKRTCSLGDL